MPRSAMNLSFISSSLTSLSCTTLECATNSDYLSAMFDSVCPTTASCNQNRVYINYNIFKLTIESAFTIHSEKTEDTKAMRICALLKRKHKKLNSLLTLQRAQITVRGGIEIVLGMTDDDRSREKIKLLQN